MLKQTDDKMDVKTGGKLTMLFLVLSMISCMILMPRQEWYQNWIYKSSTKNKSELSTPSNKPRSISSNESVVYNARKSLQMYPHSRKHQKKWEQIRRTYKPIMGDDKFYKVMEQADLDSF